MAYALDKNASLERLRDYVVGVIGSLTALKRLESLGVPGMEQLAGDWLPKLSGVWRSELTAVDAAIAARNAARDRAKETGAVVRVFDTAWDGTVRKLSGLSFLLADKKADQEPYASLFGTVKAEDLVSFGPAKATDAGARVVAKALATGEAQLVPLANALADQTKALGAADEEDAAADVQAATHDVERLKLLRRLERVGAESEAQLLTHFPGRRDLVRAVLDPEPERRGKKQESVEPTPSEPAPG